MEELDYIFYCSYCCSGLLCAIIALLRYPDTKLCLYSELNNVDIEGKHIFVSDCTFDDINDKIIIIDHRISVQLCWQDNYNFCKHDLNDDGCALTLVWNKFHPDKKLPLFLMYVEDMILDNYKFQYLKEFTAWIHTVNLSFDLCKKLLTSDKYVDSCIKSGTQLISKNMVRTNYLINNTCAAFVNISEKYYYVVCVGGCPMMPNIVKKLLDKYVDCSFVLFCENDSKNDCAHNYLISEHNRTNVYDISLTFGQKRCLPWSSVIDMPYNRTIITHTLDIGASYRILNKIYIETIKLDLMNFAVVYLNHQINQDGLASYLLQCDGVKQNCVNLYERYHYKNVGHVHFSVIWYGTNDTLECAYAVSERVDDDLHELFRETFMTDGRLNCVLRSKLLYLC